MENFDIQAKINAALESLDGIQRAEADSSLLQQIEARRKANLSARKDQQIQIRRIALRFAAAAAILLVLNCTVWFSINRQQQKNDTVQQFSETYFGTQLNY